MKMERAEWMPLTITVETRNEAEVLHKILGAVVDNTDERDGLYPLFIKLGQGLGAPSKYRTEGTVTLTDA